MSAEKGTAGGSIRRLLRAIFAVGAITACVKLLALIKETQVARQFGIGDELDVFTIAYLVPAFAVNLIAGSFNETLIPTFIEVRETASKERAFELLDNFHVGNVVLLVVVSLLLALLYPLMVPLMATGFPPEKLAQTQTVFYVLLPLIIISGFGTTWTAVLNAGERFALAAIIPALTPITILGMILLPNFPRNVEMLALATVVGTLAEVVCIAFALRRQGVPIRLVWHGMNTATRQVLRQYAPMVAGAFLMSSSALIDQAMASSLSKGSSSALAYGNRLIGLLVTLSATAVSASIMPHFSNLTARNDWKAVKRTLLFFSGLTLAVFVPVMLLVMVFSKEIVRLMYERGAFDQNATALVSQIQTLYALQIPTYVLGMIGVRLLSALKSNILLMWICGVNLIVNILANLYFMRVYGVAGIALSTSLVYLVSTILVFVCVFYKLRSVSTNHDV